ncbi:aminotransferase class III-fold pyridoxal phosphate-dependent enzyme [Planctomicrobium sp. SH661]|uniref:aminotransferase class III-fold pyridoxal phosphate-dependent enzyme n=1 Tax=Planctomicrobium sp. SH661 TaxID=3448124 RepID=UPI003F5CAA67
MKDDSKLLAAAFRSDDRVALACETLHDALMEYRQKLTTPQPPRVELQQQYADVLARFADQRGGSLFFPYLGSGLGNGALVELQDGSVKYDMISGIGVHAFGHSDPGLLMASLHGALSDTVMQGNLQQNVESSLLCQELIDLACESDASLRHCFLTTSGATANENALKLLFQKRSPASRMLAFANCFAGRTMATSQLTDRAKNRVGLPTVLAVDYVPFFNSERPDTSLEETLSVLQTHLERYPAAHAGMILELIQGEGGYYTASKEFLHGLCSFLRERSIPIWFDEIQTFGRTTRPFAFQHYGLDAFADVVTVGKLTQVCATFFTDEFVPKPGLISQTFTGATSSIFAARHILQRLQTGGYFGEQGRLMQMHARFVQHFERIREKSPHLISGPWGIGGMVAFTALDGSDASTKKFLDALFHAGVMAFSAGANPTRIRMLPPFGVIEDHQIDEVCSIIETTLLSCTEK